MICVDTTFLVDLWRNQGVKDHPTVLLLECRRGETFAVPAHAAGEFIEGAACISEERVQDALRFLRLFEIGAIGLETAETYARIVAELRERSLLKGTSKADMWIAAWAREHGADLATRNRRHFEHVPRLRIIDY
jgi:predicted nucleic acid-binding protein